MATTFDMLNPLSKTNHEAADSSSNSNSPHTAEFDEEDNYVMRFFILLGDINLFVLFVGLLAGLVMLLGSCPDSYFSSHGYFNWTIAISGVVAALLSLLDYYIWEFFILTAKGMYRNLSIIRKNVEKLTENVEIVR